MKTNTDHPIIWLNHAGQRLGLVPSLGGAVAAWSLDQPGASVDLWRPWDGATADLYQLASFPMVPWSNRISGGGFSQDGVFFPMQPNRSGEPYPIHGDGWLQRWQITSSTTTTDALTMALESNCFAKSPYRYRASQSFHLVEGGLDQELEVCHLGDVPLPYGLGLHPWFPRTLRTKVTAPVQGVWLSGADPLPIGHTTAFPATWNLAEGIDANGDLIDNGYSGWGGTARIEWPERDLQLTLTMPNFNRDGGAGQHFCLVYRPPQGPAFCFEPITQPIDAFHMEGQPGLRVLSKGQTLTLAVQWRFGPIDALG
jgi:aldose 1-epimerase